MDTNSQPLEFIRHAVACLDDTNLALLDFDILRDHLTSLVSHLDQSEQASSQHALLRSDYEQRIAGMIKAIAAVDRKRGSVEDALARIDRLTTLTTSELIAEYRHVSAAFRDSFPTTFHSLPHSQGASVPHPLAGGPAMANESGPNNLGRPQLAVGSLGRSDCQSHITVPPPKH